MTRSCDWPKAEDEVFGTSRDGALVSSMSHQKGGGSVIQSN